MKRCPYCRGLGWIVIGKVICFQCVGRPNVDYDEDDDDDDDDDETS